MLRPDATANARVFLFPQDFFMVRLQTVHHKNLLFRYSMGMKDAGSPEPRWTGSNIFPAYFVFSSSPLSLSKRSHRDPSRRDFFIPTPHPVPNNSPSQNAFPRPSPRPPIKQGPRSSRWRRGCARFGRRVHVVRPAAKAAAPMGRRLFKWVLWVLHVLPAPVGSAGSVNIRQISDHIRQVTEAGVFEGDIRSTELGDKRQIQKRETGHYLQLFCDLIRCGNRP